MLTSKSGGDEAVPVVPATQSNNPVQMDDVGPQGTDISEQPVDDPAENSNGEIPQPQPNAQPVKTPEQLLRELQQQQQMQQQQQQQQPPPSAPPPKGGPN